MASYSNAAGAVVDGSESTISTETVTGFHILKINCYSKTKEMLTVGESIKSAAFTVGGHPWHIEFYPHGYNEEEADCVSFDLFLDIPEDDDTTFVKAKFRLTLLDQAGEPVPGFTAAMGLCTFSGDVPSYGCERFIYRDELEAAHLKDDSFSIRCDVTVFKESRSRHGAAAAADYSEPETCKKIITMEPPRRGRPLVSARFMIFFLMSLLVAYYSVMLIC